MRWTGSYALRYFYTSHVSLVCWLNHNPNIILIHKAMSCFWGLQGFIIIRDEKSIISRVKGLAPKFLWEAERHELQDKYKKTETVLFCRKKFWSIVWNTRVFCRKHRKIFFIIIFLFVRENKLNIYLCNFYPIDQVCTHVSTFYHIHITSQILGEFWTKRNVWGLLCSLMKLLCI